MSESTECKEKQLREIALKIAELEKEIEEFSASHPLKYRTSKENMTVVEIRMKQNRLREARNLLTYDERKCVRHKIGE